MNIRKGMFKKSHVKASLKNCLGINLTKLVKDLYTENYKKDDKIEDAKNERYP